MKPRISLFVAAAVVGVLSAGSLALSQVTPPPAKTASPAGAKVYFIEPLDGATVKGPVKVVMGLAGMGIAPAGIDSPDTGHHHIFVDVDKVDPDVIIPMDDTHRHFGRGQTETSLTLPAGRHTLQLVLGDRNHVPHNPPVVSQKITITVAN